MILNREIQRLVHELNGRKDVSINFEGNPLTMSLLGQDAQFALTTLVYDGGNYIPHSVRKCISSKGMYPHSELKTDVALDEDRYQVSLRYQGNLHHLSDAKFHDLIEEFTTLADKWRLLLDEHDKNDLIHVRVT